MRRKSDRTAKKAKASPEKKIEKVKRTRTRRGRKQSTSSENESADESTSVQETAIVVEPQKPPVTPTKDASPEETDQVWQVKSAQAPSDTGEIQKLKICLTRPPSTPERAERSPRSKRKHTRATSSSDTPSAEGSEEKKERKSKHRSRRSTRESHDSSEKTQESQSEDTEQTESTQDAEKAESEITQSTQVVADNTPMSTTNEEIGHDAGSQAESKEGENESKDEETPASADTTVDSSSQPSEADTSQQQDQDSQGTDNGSPLQVIVIAKSPEAVAEESQDEKVAEVVKVQKIEAETAPEAKSTPVESSAEPKVSKLDENKHDKVPEPSQDVDDNATNEHDVVDLKNDVELELHAEMPDERPRRRSTATNKAKDAEESHQKTKSHQIERTESFQSTEGDSTTTTPNGHATPIVINRKRKWGSRPSKLSSQKSITISTDVLKDIIPDVKPVEFEEVIEEKKPHKRVEAKEKTERPVLPKITIDNTNSIEQRKDREQEVKEVVKPKEFPLTNRKISIVKDGEDIITSPPSPPRNKQSSILYISNLVRPFTLPQLKNLLQRTGRIVEDGFWIDRIKSRCFVIYETEDQAVETRHALHGVTWPVSNPKTLQVDFSTKEAFDKAKANEDTENTQTSTIPGTVEDWLREQDAKRERGELEKPWERKNMVREWDVGKGEKGREDASKNLRDERPLDKRRHRSLERSPEPARKFKKKEEEAPAKLLDDLFRKTKTTPCIYWLPLSAETIAVKEEQRRQHMLEHERRMLELRRRRH